MRQSYDFVFRGISFCRVSAGDFSREFRLLLLNEHFCGAGTDGGIGGQTCDVVGAKEVGALPVFEAGQREMNQRVRRVNEIGVLNDNGSGEQFVRLKADRELLISPLAAW